MKKHLPHSYGNHSTATERDLLDTLEKVLKRSNAHCRTCAVRELIQELTLRPKAECVPCRSLFRAGWRKGRHVSGSPKSPFRGQRAKILKLLVLANCGWVRLPRIIPQAAQFSGRLFELRLCGESMNFSIENRIERHRGKTHSWYRIHATEEVLQKLRVGLGISQKAGSR